MLSALTSELVNPCVLVVAQVPQYNTSAQNRWCKRVVIKNLVTSSLWFADNTLQANTKVIILASRTTQYSKVAPQKFTSSVLGFSSLVRAFNVFSGLEKCDYLAMNETSHYGVTTFDFCCFRGVTALALTILGKTLGFCHLYPLTTD
jgi:hypothetical protein